jgi:hypothetical protein
MSNAILIHGMDMMRAETKAEFVTRTQKLPCSKQYTNSLSHFFIEPSRASVGYNVGCPIDKNQALLRQADTERKAQLVVLTDQLDVYARQFLGYKKFLAIALAVQLDLFATIHETDKEEVLKIRRVDTKKTLKKIAIPTYFEIASTFNTHSALAFNKQGTDVIVWGADVRYQESYKTTTQGSPALDYMIFNFEEELAAEKARKAKKR